MVDSASRANARASAPKVPASRQTAENMAISWSGSSRRARLGHEWALAPVAFSACRKFTLRTPRSTTRQATAFLIRTKTQLAVEVRSFPRDLLVAGFRDDTGADALEERFDRQPWRLAQRAREVARINADRTGAIAGDLARTGRKRDHRAGRSRHFRKTGLDRPHPARTRVEHRM